MNLAQLRRLVGSPDAYAVQHKDGSWTPVREPLTDAVLQAHLNQELTAGTYTNVGDQAHVLVFDVDDEPESLAVAEALSAALIELGAPAYSVGISESGGKGHHVVMVLDEFTLAADIRRLGRAGLALAGAKAR